MIGKYQLNFLEQDLREAFDNRQQPMQRKMNFISGTTLFIIQLILAIRMGEYDNSFHLIYISTTISFISLLVNYKYHKVSELLIVLQTIILNISFSLIDYQDFVLSLLNNKSEMFLVGLGYGQLHCIIFQSLHKWYIKGITALSICIIGFCWSLTPFSTKLTYLVPLYLSTFFVIVAFFLWERFEKENFCLLFIQNKSLVDWQRIIKENIPQSMVFVTCPKKKSVKQPIISKTEQLKDNLSNFCGKLLPKKFREKWNNYLSKSNNNNNNNNNNYNNQSSSISAKINLNLVNSIEGKEKHKSTINKKGDEDGLVFNFVNKKFYDQFQIKDWVETQRRSITQNLINLNFHYSFGELINREDSHQSGNLICSESPIHQLLFNNIFKNIIVSSSSTGESKSFVDIDNSGDPTQHSVESTQSLSDYLKQFIEEKENEDKDLLKLEKQSSKTKIMNSQNNTKYSYLFSNPIKQLSCFYRQLSPFFLFGQQFQEKNEEKGTNLPTTGTQEHQQLQKKQSQVSIQQNVDKYGMNKNEDQIDENIQNQENNHNLFMASPQSNYMSKNLTANFGTQISKQFDTKVDIDGHLQDNPLLQSQPNVQTEKNSFKKLDLNGQQMYSQNHFEANNQNQQNNPTLCIISPTFSGNKKENIVNQKNQQQENLQTQEQRDICDTKQQDHSNSNLKSQQGEDKTQPYIYADKMAQKQVKFSNQEDQFHPQMKENNHLQNQTGQNQNEFERMKNGQDKYNNVVQNVIHNNKAEKSNNQDYKDRNDDRKNRNSIFQDKQENAFFFDTQMVRCLWGNEEGILLIFNDVSLKIINEKLREIERFKDKMLSTVTHDLKTPLNSIIMILENSFEMGGLNKKQRKIILQNSQMLMSLINDILDYSQLRRDKFRLIIEEICFTQCIMDVVDLFEIQAEQKRIKISASFINLQQEYIMQDERRIKQILVNLIGNALKFTQQEGKIDVIVKQKFTDCIQIAVKDTGTGISEQIQKKLFQFFNTFDHSERANNRHGIGLGLAICKQLNTQLGPWHEIKLKSKVDKGSKFTFCIYTNLIEHQQVGQPLNAQNQSSSVKRKSTFDNTQLLFHNQQISQNKQKETPYAAPEVHKLEAENQIISDLLKSPQTCENIPHFLQLPHPPIIHHSSPNQQKSKQLQKMGQFGLNNQSPENLQEKSHKSDFNSQHELHSKSINSPHNHPFNKSYKMEEIQTENNNKQLSSRPLSRDIQSNNQIVRMDSKVTQKINSTAAINPQQQHSTSIIKYQDQKIQQMFPRRSIKRDYIVLKGSRHKLINSQKAFTMKLMIEDLNRRKKTMMFNKSQTVDPFVKKSQKYLSGGGGLIGFPSNHILDNVKKGNQMNNQFYSEKNIPSPSNQQKGESSQGVIFQHLYNNKPMFGSSYTINNFSSSIPSKHTNPITSVSYFNPSIYMSDQKRLEKKMKDHNSIENQFTHLHRLQQQRQMTEKLKEKQEENNQLESKLDKKNMFIRVLSKNFQDTNSIPFKEGEQLEIERDVSENFGENEEIYKKRQRTDNINEGAINNNNMIDVNIPNKSIFQGYHDLQVVQSIPVHHTDNILFTSTAKQLGDQTKLQQSQNFQDFQFNQSNPLYSKQFDENKIQYFDKLIQQRASIYDSSNKHMQFYSKGIKTPTNQNQMETREDSTQKVLEEEDEYLIVQRDKRNANGEIDGERGEEEEEDDYDDDDENEERFQQDSDDDDDEYDNNNKQQHDKEMGNNLKFIENNIEKWIQNDRKLQVEILKTLLQDYQRALIADDSPFNIFCLQQILMKIPDLTITVAYNGNEALNSYKQNRQQIIFMDLNMPVLDGYECLKCIRQYEEDNHIEEKTKIIVISAQEYEPFFNNFDGYLSKPIKLIDIINLLQIFKSNLTNTTSSQAQI